MEDAAKLVEVIELGDPSGLTRREQLRIYDILLNAAAIIRKEAALP